MKKCNKCDQTKSLSDFATRGSGYRTSCKLCCAAETKEWRKKNKEYVKEKKRISYLNNKEHIKAKTKEYRIKNLEQVKIKQREKYESENQHRLGKPTGKVQAEFKICPKCKENKPRSDYFKKLTTLSYLCKPCTNLHAIDRNRKVRDRTPKWADMDAIAAMYLTRPKGHHVDHIIPIFGIIDGRPVSGLHVHYNLQHLPASENLSKQNHITESDLSTTALSHPKLDSKCPSSNPLD